MDVMLRSTFADRFRDDLSAAGAAAVITTAYREYEAVWPTLAPLSATYPAFAAWYWGKVVPGIEDGTRRIFMHGPFGVPDAVGIAKRHSDERKICTLWVAPKARGCGIASDLLEAMIDWLGDDRPLLTVPAERHGEFVPLVRKFGFYETARLRSLYRDGVVEHVFNGTAKTFLVS